MKSHKNVLMVGEVTRQERAAMKLKFATPDQAPVPGSHAHIYALFSYNQEASAESVQMVYAGNIGTQNINSPRDKAV